MARFNWGTGIAATYTAFALATTSVVAFAVTRRVDLVTPDYYAEALRQDAHMRAAQNAQRLPTVSIAQTAPRAVTLTLPSEHAGAAGTITLYRASDAASDRLLPLAVDSSGHQTISLEGLASGHWLLKLRWSAGGRDYYIERPVIAP